MTPTTADTAASNRTSDHRLIDLNELTARLSVSHATIYRLMLRKEFPRPVKIGKASRWDEAQVNRWLEHRLAGTHQRP